MQLKQQTSDHNSIFLLVMQVSCMPEKKGEGWNVFLGS